MHPTLLKALAAEAARERIRERDSHSAPRGYAPGPLNHATSLRRQAGAGEGRPDRLIHPPLDRADALPS